MSHWLRATARTEMACAKCAAGVYIEVGGLHATPPPPLELFFHAQTVEGWTETDSGEWFCDECSRAPAASDGARPADSRLIPG